MTLKLFSGAWGKTIHEKNQSKKSRDTVPLIAHNVMYKCTYIIMSFRTIEEFAHHREEKHGRLKQQNKTVKK
jgi:hypothetical protein